ncbi:hypothetical protein [Ornithinimicrobium cavernae]|uniref:hypothetical protein n=1 Tax=Ornithinimicrobium cavernae TaxID=2666047 RepID=UPI0012B161B8|nr:hypothetical protein [Ornithinimicrobium cavernae]
MEKQRALLARVDEDLRLLGARLDRAVTHFENFGDLWSDYLNQKPHRTELVPEADGSTCVQLRRDVVIPAEISVVLGEFLYEMRAALDNCLYAVAVITSGQNPPPRAERLEWPIRETSRQWTSQAGRYEALPTEVVDALETIQPYRAEFPSWNSLAILHDLARFDRHRTPKGLALYLVRVRMRVDPAVIEVLDVGTEGVIHDGDTLVRIKVASGHAISPENFDLDVEFDVDVEDVQASPGPTGRPGRPWGSLATRLRSVHKAVADYCDGILAVAVDCAGSSSEP